MLSGSISLKHPGLNHDRTELGQTLDKVAQINSSAARALKDAKVAESLDESKWNLWEQSRETAGSQFNALKSLSEASLRTASHLAFAAASFYSTRVQEKVCDGEVVNENPLFNTESAASDR